jgi:hypothetical protein
LPGFKGTTAQVPAQMDGVQVRDSAPGVRAALGGVEDA